MYSRFLASQNQVPCAISSSNLNTRIPIHALLTPNTDIMNPHPPSPHDSAISVSSVPVSKGEPGREERSPPPHAEAQSQAGPAPTSKRNSIPPKSSSPRASAVPPPSDFSSETEASAALEQAQDGIEIDDAGPASPYPPTDDGYETDSLASASTSLASSVRNYAFENGRRYHKFREGSYNFPNDDSEQDREDMKHAMMVNLLGGKLHFAPIDEGPKGMNGKQVLDMGTGTGIWAIEMGDLYPGANILGVDLSPIQPEWVPPNVKFMVDDVESPWLKPLDYFDYVHARHTVMAIRNWPLLMSRVLDHLKPGGWFELQEIHHYPQCHDGSMPPSYAIAQYWGLIIEALGNLGVNFNATLLLEDMMRSAGFVNVSTRIFHVPIGLWPKNKVLKMVGLYWRTILIDGLEPIALGPLTRGLKWTKEQVDVWLVEVRKAYMEGGVHSHMPCYVICGQKPEVGRAPET